MYLRSLVYAAHPNLNLQRGVCCLEAILARRFLLGQTPLRPEGQKLFSLGKRKGLDSFCSGELRSCPALLLFLFLFLLLPARQVSAQISPGPLSRPHQSLNGATNCASCHKFGGQAALKCLECHTEIATRLSAHRGLHATYNIPPGSSQPCARCHSEHNGEDFPLIKWDIKSFNHNDAGYVLEGKHARLACNKCHNPSHISPQERASIKIKDPNRTYLGDMVLNRSDFNVTTGEKVEHVETDEQGIFTVTTSTNQYRARAVVLALGRAGEPRKLGVKGEDLPKVMYRLIEADHYINKKILVIGGGDSAVEAAMGLANQKGNQVALSYRSERFSRIKERNAKRIEEYSKSGKVKVIFNSNPVEFKPESVILDIAGTKQEMPNDFVWIFAGGTPPNAFLKKIGVGFGAKDVTLEASKAAKQADVERKQFTEAAASTR